MNPEDVDAAIRTRRHLPDVGREFDEVGQRLDVLSDRVYVLEARARGQFWALVLLFLIVVMLATKVLTS